MKKSVRLTRSGGERSQQAEPFTFHSRSPLGGLERKYFIVLGCELFASTVRSSKSLSLPHTHTLWVIQGCLSQILHAWPEQIFPLVKSLS